MKRSAEQNNVLTHTAMTTLIDKHRPYSAFKSSGTEWLGDIPAHWEVRQLRYNTEMRVSNVDKHTKEHELPVRLCNYVDVYNNEFITGRMAFMSATATFAEIGRFRLEVGDVLITKDSETWDDIGVPALVEHVADDLICGYHLALLRSLKSKLNGRFLLRALQSPVVSSQFHVGAKGVTRFGLTHISIKTVQLPLPPLAEQRAIAAFLDRETAKIDVLVSKNERLIELLQEKRTALISHTVTKGLNSDIPMKDSGIEWIGEIPAHWDVKRLRYTAEMRVSNVDKHTKEDELPVRLCNYVDVYNNDHIVEGIAFMPATATVAEIDRFRLEIGDVLITKDSETWVDIGVPAIVEHVADDLICGYHLALLRPVSPLLHGGFLLRALQSPALSYHFQVEAKGVTRYGLTHSSIKSAQLPVPPLDEQIAIASFLDSETAQLDNLVAKVNTAISLLHELRTALISAAVTGKIDVRVEEECT